MQQALNQIKPELRQWIKDAVSEVLINTISVVLVKLKDEIIAAYSITKSEAYVSSVKLAMKHMIRYFGPQMEIGKIGVKELEGFLAHLMKGAPKGYRVYYRTLKAVFNVAINWGYISINPFTKIKISKRQLNKAEYPDEYLGGSKNIFIPFSRSLFSKSTYGIRSQPFNFMP